MEDKLADIYSVQKFKELGIELIELIADHLKNSYEKKQKSIIGLPQNKNWPIGKTID